MKSLNTFESSSGVELHRHLDGSLRLKTATEWAKLDGVDVPQPLIFDSGMGLGPALERFAFTLKLLQHPDRIRTAAFEMIEDAKAEKLFAIEVRFAPQLHNLDYEESVDAALDGVDGQAGLILCGLYGEDPKILEALVQLAQKKKGVVGVDLAGGPNKHHTFSLLDYAPHFQKAREAGLGVTIHAGEGRPPEEIAIAIDACGAQRIGHGTTLANDPKVLERVLRNNVTVEACISSNLHTSAIPKLNHHPLKSWLHAGVQVCLCADNTLFSETDIPKERHIAQTHLGLEQDDLEKMKIFGRNALFSSQLT